VKPLSNQGFLISVARSLQRCRAMKRTSNIQSDL